jgi:hypothetical protein
VPGATFEDRKMADSKVADLVLEYIESVWNGGDTSALKKLTTRGFEYHLGGQPARDRSEMEEFLQLVRSAFPDWRVTVSGTVAQGDDVAVRWTGTVTHQGDFRGMLARPARLGLRPPACPSPPVRP